MPEIITGYISLRNNTKDRKKKERFGHAQKSFLLFRTVYRQSVCVCVCVYHFQCHNINTRQRMLIMCREISLYGVKQRIRVKKTTHNQSLRFQDTTLVFSTFLH